jgi:hypothetical protein
MASVVDETAPFHLPDDPRPGDDRRHCQASAVAAVVWDAEGAAVVADVQADAGDAVAAADAPNSSRGDTRGARGNNGPNSRQY